VAKVNFKITAERVAEVCSYVEYLNLNVGDKRTAILVSPRFALNEKGEYSMIAKHDEDGDVESFDNWSETMTLMASVTLKRLEKLIPEFREAAANVVNPQSGRD
jgi:hypothetical protein